MTTKRYMILSVIDDGAKTNTKLRAVGMNHADLIKHLTMAAHELIHQLEAQRDDD